MPRRIEITGPAGYAFLLALAAAVIVFLYSSISLYFDLVAHQPSRDHINPTGFPPSAAFHLAAGFAVLTYAVVFLIAWPVVSVLTRFFQRGAFRNGGRRV